MGFHRQCSTQYITKIPTHHQPITLAYHRHVQSGQINLDNNQLSLSVALDSLYRNLSSYDRFTIPDDRLDHVAWFMHGAPHTWQLCRFCLCKSSFFCVHTTRGYISTDQLFYETCNDGLIADNIRATNHNSIHYEPIQRKAMQCHFHELMLGVHQQIHNYKLTHPKADPIPPVAASFARQAHILCSVEVQITDIADTMIMKQIITLLMDLGVTIVTMSIFRRVDCMRVD